MKMTKKMTTMKKKLKSLQQNKQILIIKRFFISIELCQTQNNYSVMLFIPLNKNMFSMIFLSARYGLSACPHVMGSIEFDFYAYLFMSAFLNNKITGRV